ncbi:hypothetical protein J3R30DRAFT_3447740 [Lentinula aciculospora]|uniref:Transmembrane protein n=1 Tax=Lentinula aciculospora TaxID=153920 RepID=A0A9W9AIF2_9AGAR|nr:hypothetical protein J3R30DRAFT_3447740 [Lentinula aciculospora]
MNSNVNSIAGPSYTPVTPPAAVVHDSNESSSPISPFDAFFGYTLSQTATRESQHDRPLSSSSFTSESELLEALPPAYVEPPAYETRQTEPATLAMFLFKFGFLFPLFWIMGALILLTPLRAPEPSLTSFSSPSSASSDSSLPAAWLPEKTPAEKQQIISRMRSVEVKWAWRCLIALCIFLVSVVAIVATTWGIIKITQKLS